MTRITIPSKLDDRLGQDALGHAVRLYVKQFEGWVGDDTKGLFFFPEYTDHGPKHISSVLAASEALIREESWPLLATEDAAVLVLATLLHDSAMHLTADGLLDLLSPEHAAQRPLIDQLDSKTWPALFDDFFAEARRWDQRKLHRILGDQNKPSEEEEDLVDTIRRLSELPDPEQWTVRYRKLLGEFVRRHHARLAHEIVHEGVPGNTAGMLKPPTDLDRVADLAGLVARSHNMSLRGTFAYLEAKYYGRMTCRNAHPVFLMVVLRVADYLEIRPDRVNPTLLQIQRLRNPLSQEEQNSHLDIEEVRPDEHDEEAVFVVAKPQSAHSFLKLQRLLQGLQAELDTSWAVLGEVFSRDKRLRDLEIGLRRVRSNQDDPAEFLEREQPKYFPIRAAFDTAGADLLKLLIKPLYRDRPGIGIRELLQNALDAVHELRQWAADRGDPELRQIPRPDQESDVLIAIDEDGTGQHWLTITDKGIGMKAETVRDYFLKAGASFRQSKEWCRDFQSQGASKVLRSGRFGIGALAAFLLGDRIYVSTRYVDEPVHSGIRFSASVTDSEIELLREARKEVGTTIRIPLTTATAESFSDSVFGEHPWDWFVLDDPQVERRRHGIVLSQELYLPGCRVERSDRSDMNWSRVYHPDYQGIDWSYSGGIGFACNGILCSLSPPRDRWHEDPLNVPQVSVFDRDGKFPLNLLRNNLETEDYPFSDELLTDVTADLLSFLLSHSPEDCEAVKPWALSPYMDSSFPFNGGDLWWTPRGALLNHRWHIKRAQIRKALVFVVKQFEVLDAISLQADAVRIVRYPNRHEDDEAEVFYFLENGFGLETEGIRIWLPAQASIQNCGKAEKTGAIESAIDLVKKGSEGIFAIAELQLDPGRIDISSSPFTQLCEEVFGHSVIPFDPAERKAKFPTAFAKLKDRLEVWQSPNLAGWRRWLLDHFQGDYSQW